VMVHGEITTSSRLSLTLLNNKNQKDFKTIDRRSDGHRLLIRLLTSKMYQVGP
jgi:hypothetical protein